MMGSGRRRAGKELYLDTEAGRVRVLAYNLEDPRTLPLFVNIHGGGFTIGHAGDGRPLHARHRRRRPA